MMAMLMFNQRTSKKILKRSVIYILEPGLENKHSHNSLKHIDIDGATLFQKIVR